ncbi:MAG TPA: hypothetical protein PLM53_18530 [Spirochaetota bacterium]|nr:hypothetical protein [Spirochaetota bacterium]HPC42621.1 hypothetical protein [Spirochaetota bacterium]HPL17982.1 hypothetical protein [Spirochaetota bacterium]HQF08459.1 hypothetical protein [Spirochaetota bacterium]HQH99097.1 hypothetical protein [Spirochaetota bacterium]
MYAAATGLNGGGTGSFAGDVFLPWEGGSSYYSKWSHGPSSEPDYFPIAVWLQSPCNAEAYRAIGINTFVGLWEGPTEDQLGRLADRGMPVLCAQNAAGLGSPSNPVISAWTHDDEPDNAQADGQGGYGPPISTASIVAGYQSMVAADPTRPVFLNLGQGVAWDGWYGRGVRTGHPEDYAEYIKGADIISYDIYPVNSRDTAVKDRLWLVAYGVDRLRRWSNYKKPVWNWIECTDFNGSGRKPTPSEVKAEVWMSIIHGSMGIGYFVHVFSPTFIEAGLLSDAHMSSAVAAINAQITSLAPVLNTPSVANGVTVTSSSADVPVDVMLKRYNGETYLFAVSMRPGITTATFTLRDFPADAEAEVIGENRVKIFTDGVMRDSFTDYTVHLYRITWK